MAFKDDSEIAELVRRFEACEIHPAEFRHYQHLTVALWYVLEFSDEVATEKLRTGIQKLAAAYGKSGYHETITLFWLSMVKEFVSTADRKESICGLANRLIANYDDKSLINEYYSEALIASSAAKSGWVAPDLKGL